MAEVYTDETKAQAERVLRLLVSETGALYDALRERWYWQKPDGSARACYMVKESERWTIHLEEVPSGSNGRAVRNPGGAGERLQQGVGG